MIAEKLVDQDCISQQHVPPVVEQLERVIQSVKTDPTKVLGLKITSYVDATTGSVDTIVRQMSQDAMASGSHASVRILGLFPIFHFPYKLFRSFRFFLTACNF